MNKIIRMERAHWSGSTIFTYENTPECYKPVRFITESGRVLEGSRQQNGYYLARTSESGRNFLEAQRISEDDVIAWEYQESHSAHFDSARFIESESILPDPAEAMTAEQYAERMAYAFCRISYECESVLSIWEFLSMFDDDMSNSYHLYDAETLEPVLLEDFVIRYADLLYSKGFCPIEWEGGAF